MRARKSALLQPFMLLAAFALSAVSPLAGLLAQERSTNPQRPLQTELIAPLDAGKLSRGAPAFAKVKFNWESPACKLKAGSTIVGHIADLEQRSKQNKGSTITLVFDKADCNGQASAPFSLVVFAVIGDDSAYDGTGMIDREGLFGTTTLHPASSMGGGLSNGGSSQPIVPPSYDPNTDMSIRGGLRKKTPDKILPGQVIGLRKITLSVGSGLEGGSVLTGTNRNIRLDRTTLLVLMPKDALVYVNKPHATTPDATASISTENNTDETSNSVHETAAAAPPPPPEPIDETEVCTSDCSAVSNTLNSSIPRARAFASLSAAHLGYTPHDKREFTAFNYESTLTYMDSSTLLFTFDLHKLRQRSGSGIRPESTRIVRAALMDSSTRTLKRVLDWQVQGEGQYLWRIGSGHVLVHMGHQLRLLKPDLTSVHSIPVPGVLTWVATSPNGSHFAVGLMHERHTPTLHQQIFEANNIEPEEDIDVQVYDRDFNLLLTTSQPSTMYPPVLSDGGEILVHAAGHNRWQISEYRWDGTEHTIATTTSKCHPNITTPLSDYLMVIGCAAYPALNWYRILRMDGHAVLEGHPSSQEIEQAVDGAAGHEFAVRVARTFGSKGQGSAFHKTDLKEQEISVYESTRGRRLFTTTAGDMPLTEQSFALSPSGHQLALVRNDSIAFYSIDDPAPTPNHGQ